MNKEHFTNWYELKGNRFNSCYGFVNWEEWMKAEKKHMAEIGRKGTIITEIKDGEKTGRYALARIK